MDQKVDKAPADIAADGSVAGAPSVDASWSRLLEPRHLAVTSALSLGIALYSFNEFFLTTALPTAVGEIGGAAYMSWAYSIFLVLSIVGGMVAANFKRRRGARAALLWSALVVFIGTIATVVAPDMGWLIAGRAVQGFGLGIVVAVCYALIPELIAPELLPKIFGVEAAVWAVAALVAPAFAGLLTEQFSWRVAFAVDLPAAILFAGLVLVAVPGRRDQPIESARLPVLRLALAACGIFLVSLAATVGSVSAIGLLLAAAVSLVLSVRRDRRSADPIMPKQAFRLDSALGLGLWVILVMPLTQAASAVFMVFAFQHLWGMGATLAGALAALMAIAWSLSAIFVAMVDRPRLRLRLATLGPFLLTIGMVAAAVGISREALALVLIGQVTIGLGFGVNWGPLCQALMELTPPATRDRTSAMLPTLQAAGFALGAALFGLVANLGGFGDNASPEEIRFALVVTYGAACLSGLAASVAGIAMYRRAVSLV